ncbi:MAG: cupin domain-containing protein [Proteobacteria bacterium]|nr:cupin domain-containing protein [Pseudomonadota bacterium]
MPKIDIAAAPQRIGSGYPAPFHEPCAARVRKQLGDAAGLSDFGVNLLTLRPGAWSSQRHWHDIEDEFVYVLSGEVVLVTDDGETTLKAGDCAGFPKNASNGHHLVNRSNADATLLEIGTRTTDDVTTYSDIDMKYDPKLGGYVRRNGEPYPERKA